MEQKGGKSKNICVKENGRTYFMNETFYLFLSRKEQQQVLQNLEQRGFLWESGKKPTDFPAVQNIILRIDRNGKKIEYIL